MSKQVKILNKVLRTKKKKEKRKSNQNTARTLQSQITKACFLGNKSLVNKKICKQSLKKFKQKIRKTWAANWYNRACSLKCVFACKHQKLVWVQKQY